MTRRFLPIAGSAGFTRPINEWINLVNSKKSELESLLQRNTFRQEAAAWRERELVKFALGTGESGAAGETPDIGVIASLHELERQIKDIGSRPCLTPQLVLGINNLLGGTTETWNTPRAERSLEMACDWFSADSFDDLHPVEQAATVHLRLLEIRAFEHRNQLTSLLSASMFTMRAGFPPIMIPQALEQSHRAALDEAKRMNTRPMVELIANAVDVALDDLIRTLKQVKR